MKKSAALKNLDRSSLSEDIVRNSNNTGLTDLMRKINTRDFHVATRTTSRDINRHIALNLIREHQPISRADLARGMKMTRGVVSVLVQELIAQGLIYEGRLVRRHVDASQRFFISGRTIVWWWR